MNAQAQARSHPGAVTIALAIALAGSVLGWSLILRHFFPHGDDFLHAVAGEQPGDAQSLSRWWGTWSFDYAWRNGRAADALTRLVLMTGRPGVAVIGVLVMVLTGLASWLWLRTAAPGRHVPPVFAVLAVLVPFLALQIDPQLTGEGLLWASGLTNYAVSTLAFLIAALALSGALTPRATWLALPVVAYAHIGHEVAAVATAAVTVLVLVWRRPQDRARRAAVVVSGFGFLLLVSAPGLWRRTTETEMALPLLQALSRTTVLFASLSLWWWLALGALAVVGIRLNGRRPGPASMVAGAVAWASLWLIRGRWPVIQDLCAEPDTGVPTALVAAGSLSAAVVLVAAVLRLTVQAWGASRAYPVLAMTVAGLVSAGVPVVAFVCGARGYFLPLIALVLATVCALRLVVDQAMARPGGSGRLAVGLVVGATVLALVSTALYVQRASGMAAANEAAYETFAARIEQTKRSGQGTVVVPEPPAGAWMYARGFYLLRYDCDIRHFYGIPDGVVLTDGSGPDGEWTESTTGCLTTWQRSLSRARQE